MLHLNQLTSRTKLIIGFAAIVIFTLIMILVSYNSILQINKNQQKLDEWMSLTQQMTHLRAEGNLLRAYMLEEQILLVDGEEAVNLQKLEEITAGIKSSFSKLQNDLSEIEGFDQNLSEVIVRFEQFMNNHHKQLELIQAKQVEEFLVVSKTQYRDFVILTEDFERMEAQMLLRSDNLHLSSAKIIEKNIIISLLVGGLVIVIVMLIVIGTFRMLRRILREMNQAVEVLSTSSAEIETTISEISTGAAETATAISETTATIEEIRQTSMLANEKAKIMIDDAANASEAASHGLDSSEKMVDAISEIDKQMQQINHIVQKLASQSNSIGEITSTVSDIADQSNLLAVNAAIEAAKAGELGRGFGVVAQEIRSLAEQSKKSTAQVKDILEQMREQVMNAVELIKKGGEAVDIGSKIVHEDKEITMILAENIETTNQASIQISSTSQQQMAGMDQIVPAMNNIKMASEQNVTAMRQVRQASADLNELGRNIQKLLNRYKI